MTAEVAVYLAAIAALLTILKRCLDLIDRFSSKKRKR